MQQGDLVDIIQRATEELETLITDRALKVIVEATDLDTVTYFDAEKNAPSHD